MAQGFVNQQVASSVHGPELDSMSTGGADASPPAPRGGAAPAALPYVGSKSTNYLTLKGSFLAVSELDLS